MTGTTFVSLAIYAKDSEGWGVGSELYNKETQADGSIAHNVYHFFSFYLSKSEFPSKRRVIHYMLSEILPKVRDEDEGVRFLSTLPHFEKASELRRKAGIYVSGKQLEFIRTSRIRRDTVALAIDAVKRKESISERLID
jgi:hypothetical protein